MVYDPTAAPPEISILLLGDAEVGKSTFLSYVPDMTSFTKMLTTRQPLDPRYTRPWLAKHEYADSP